MRTEYPEPENIICHECEHYIGGYSCFAFPDSIPDEIVKGQNNHSEPLSEQGNEIVFETIEG